MMHSSRTLYAILRPKVLQVGVSTGKYHHQMDSLTMLERSYFNELLPLKSHNYLRQLDTSSLNYSVYAGFDPSADSLQLGNLIALMGLLRYHMSGKDVVVVVGEGTACVGDPSGRLLKRANQSKAQFANNALTIEKSINTIFANYWNHFVPSFSYGSSLGTMHIFNNSEWLESLTCSHFVEQVAIHFRIPELLDKESVKIRLEDGGGLDLSEFLYPILQAFDFYHLHEQHHCRIQIGGHDQLGNITCGLNLIKRKCKQNVFGLTMPLLTSPDGSKWGKSTSWTGSAAGPIWLSPQKLRPYNFYQCIFNLQDTYVSHKLLRQLTFFSPEEIDSLMLLHEEFPHRRPVQKRLAQELTLLVHGAEALQVSELASRIFYPQANGMHTSHTSMSVLSDDLNLLERNFLVECLAKPVSYLPVLSVAAFSDFSGTPACLQSTLIDLLYQTDTFVTNFSALHECASKGIIFNDVVLTKPGTVLSAHQKTSENAQEICCDDTAMNTLYISNSLLTEAFQRCDSATGIGILKIGRHDRWFVKTK